MDRKMITTDCHVSTPPTVVDQLPEKYREHFPRIDRRDDGDYLVHPRLPERMAAMAGGSSDGFKLPTDDPAGPPPSVSPLSEHGELVGVVFDGHHEIRFGEVR